MFRRATIFGGKLSIIFCIVLAMLATLGLADSEETYRKFLIDGDKLMSQGRSKYQEAVSKYTSAVQLKPSDKKAYYRRAELYSMMKEYRRCEDDIDSVLKLDAEHHQSIALRSKIRSGMGEFLEAANDEALLVKLFKKQKNAKKAAKASENEAKYRRIGESWGTILTQINNYPRPSSPQYNKKAFRDLNRRCVDTLRDILPLVKDSAPLRMQRVRCALAAHMQQVSSDELRVLLKTNPNNLEAIVLNARSMRMMGAGDLSRKEVRRCLNLDPEYAPCKALHRNFKRVQALVSSIEASVNDKKYAAALEAISSALKEDEEVAAEEELIKWQCEAYLGARDVDNGIASCTELIELYGADSPSSVTAYLNRAELYWINDDNEKAKENVAKAASINPQHEKVREFQQRIETAKQNAGRKDYYKLLGVPKSSSAEEIRRAYRKLARKHHPDHYAKDITAKERERQDKLFRDLNEAKEILMDEEKRRRYDAGEDPANPNKPQQGHHHHFPFPGGFPGGMGGGMPGGFNFGGGNFQFRFG